MFPHIDNPFDTRPPAKQGVPEFLDALGDPQAAEAYRQAMGEEASPSTTDAQEPQLTPEELACLHAAEAALRDTQEKKDLVALKADYLAWAKEFNLGGDDREEWISDTFTFNLDGTVEVDDDLDLSYRRLTRLPPALTRVNGYLSLTRNRLTSLKGLPQEIHSNLYLGYNKLTSLEGLPQEIHGSLYLGGNQLASLDGLPQEIHGDLDLSYSRLLTSLDELKGKKINGDLYLRNIPAQSIPKGIELGGKVVVNADQTVLAKDARNKGYAVREE